MLWFLGVYLVTLAFVLALTRMRSGRAAGLLVTALLAAAGAMDRVRIATGVPMSGVLNFLLVWLIPVTIGCRLCASADRCPGGPCRAVSAFAAQAVLARQAVAVGNGGAMTLYLWHIPAIAVATFSLHAIGLDAYDVDARAFWGLLALRGVVFAFVMAATFFLLSPLEHRRLPWWDCEVRATGVRSTTAGVLICVAGVALVLLAKNGLAGVAGCSLLGFFLPHLPRRA